MNEMPRRQWLRFHLSTLIAMSFAAAVLLWANVHVHFEEYGVSRGFPFPMYWKLQLPSLYGESNFALWSHNSYAKVGPFRFSYQDSGWSVGLIVLNALICTVALSFVAAVSEFFIRRRGMDQKR